MIKILEIWVKEEMLQHLLPKRSAFVSRGVCERLIITHLEV